LLLPGRGAAEREHIKMMEEQVALAEAAAAAAAVEEAARKASTPAPGTNLARMRATTPRLPGAPRTPGPPGRRTPMGL
jgi:hypothetical protein